MSFSDNLKKARKDKGLSQEDLAELISVSRQAVSKWENGEGYPEAEKHMTISKKLSISLDTLMDTQAESDECHESPKDYEGILITSPNENVIMQCVKVMSSQKFKTGKQSPKYALYGTDGSSSLFGENSTFLGWYADKESISEETSEIQASIFAGEKSYVLKYTVKTEMHWGSVKIVQ